MACRFQGLLEACPHYNIDAACRLCSRVDRSKDLLRKLFWTEKHWFFLRAFWSRSRSRLEKQMIDNKIDHNSLLVVQATVKAYDSWDVGLVFVWEQFTVCEKSDAIYRSGIWKPQVELENGGWPWDLYSQFNNNYTFVRTAFVQIDHGLEHLSCNHKIACMK